MIRTALLLVATLIAIPFFAFLYDAPLSDQHWHALKMLFSAAGFVALLCFVVGEATQNNSQVDKLWSIVPAFYVGYVALISDWDPRLTLMFVLVAAWAARLTFNFARRGGYAIIPWQGEEDYRWSILRKDPNMQGRWRWTIFNLLFICGYQNTLILMFTLPSIVAWQGADTPLNLLDYTAAALMLGFLIIETVADQQQWTFQREKYRFINAGQPLPEAYAKGFCDTGLWGIVRHPNYAAEQAIWISFYLFSVAATGRWINWSLTGAILLCLLFLGSSDFSEKISAGKYPAYRDYMQRLGRFVPNFSKK
jgi:steroid 5-alpha reductase family enzyme